MCRLHHSWDYRPLVTRPRRPFAAQIGTGQPSSRPASRVVDRSLGSRSRHTTVIRLASRASSTRGERMHANDHLLSRTLHVSSVLLPLVLANLLLVSFSCGEPSFRSLDELARAYIKNAKEGGSEELSALYPRTSAVGEICTDAQARERLITKGISARQHVCDSPTLNAGDVSRVSVISGTQFSALPGCGGNAISYVNTWGLAETDDESQAVLFEFPGLAKFGESFLLLEPVRCIDVARLPALAAFAIWRVELAKGNRPEPAVLEQLIEAGSRVLAKAREDGGRQDIGAETYFTCMSEAADSDDLATCTKVYEEYAENPPHCAKLTSALTACATEMPADASDLTLLAARDLEQAWLVELDKKQLDQDCIVQAAIVPHLSYPSIIEICPEAAPTFPKTDANVTPPPLEQAAIYQAFAGWRTLDKERRDRLRDENIARQVEARSFSRGAPDWLLTPKPTAKVVLVEFGYFQCPLTARASERVTTLALQYRDVIKFVFLHRPASYHAYARSAAVYTEAARRQGAFDLWHYELFRHTGIDDSTLLQLASSFDSRRLLSLARLVDDINSGYPDRIVDYNSTLASALQISETPAFFVNGKYVRDASMSDLQKAIDEELKEAEHQSRSGRRWIWERTRQQRGADFFRNVYLGATISRPKPNRLSAALGTTQSVAPASVQLAKIGSGSAKLEVEVDLTDESAWYLYWSLRRLAVPEQRNAEISLLALPDSAGLGAKVAAALSCLPDDVAKWSFLDHLMAWSDDHPPIRYFVDWAGGDLRAWDGCIQAKRNIETPPSTKTAPLRATFNGRQVPAATVFDTYELELLLGGTEFSEPKVPDSLRPVDPSAPQSTKPTVEPAKEPAPGRQPDRKRSSLLNAKGLSARKIGRHSDAEAYYRQAIDADPNNIWARYNLACELNLAGRVEDALEHLAQIGKSNHQDAADALEAAIKDKDFRSLRHDARFQALTREF